MDESDYEKRLRREIEIIEARISELTRDRETLHRQLLKARYETGDLRDVNRKNSGPRVMVEGQILRALQSSPKPIENKALYKEALQANARLKPTTFRSHLHRLKSKGLIEQAGRQGRWKATSQRSDEENPISE